MKNILRIFSLTVLCCLGAVGYAQGPVCTDINAAIEPDDSATINVSSFITNTAVSLPADITIENPYGGVLKFLPAVADADLDIRVAACPYLGRDLKIVVKNASGSCWSKLTFHANDAGPIIVGRDTAVYCTDSLVFGGHIGGVPPTATLPCTGDVLATFVSDWIDVYPCELGNDTAKVIIRQYEAYDKFGKRGIGADTITVFRLPLLDETNIYCVERDTVYCGDLASAGKFGPYFLVPTEVGGTECDTVHFLNPDGTAVKLDPKCGLSVAVESEGFDNACEKVTKYTVSIKQTCYGADPTCVLDAPSTDLEGSDGYYTCTFWLMDFDTLAPIVYCDSSAAQNMIGDTLIIPSGSHDCAATVKLPPAIAVDACSGVKQVKASIEGYGSYAFSLVGGQWVSNSTITLPFAPDPIAVVYEAYDECHNVGYDTCYILVKDLTRPVAVCDKGVNVSLTDKKVWVSAETFDEGSWDNCGINMLLVRRADWQDACINLCDSLDTIDVTHYDEVIYRPILQSDQTIEPVEAHYQKAIDWLDFDGQACAELIKAGWEYDLAKYATLECKASANETSFEDWAANEFGPYYDDARQIGGGWGSDVVFDCADACGKVTVEILVVDYWCNWSKCWTDVWVEDKTPVSVVKDVDSEIGITCKTFKSADYSLGGVAASISDLVIAGAEGDTDALAALDEILGGYKKAWTDPYGNFVDADGVELDCEIDLYDSACVCTTFVSNGYDYDEHLGWIEVSEYVDSCYYVAEKIELQHGVVAINCTEGVSCDQKIWYEFDQCGQGVVYRKFKMYRGCPTTDLTAATHVPDTITRVQRIYIGNQCELTLGMFNMPADTIIDVCGIEYDPEGSGNVAGEAAASLTGRPEYTFDDDCRLVGIGYTDKVFRIVGGDEACYKIIRTWCFADWCEFDEYGYGYGVPAGAGSYDPYVTHDQLAGILDEYGDDILKYKQTIIIRDTVAPQIVINPLVGGNEVSALGCTYSFSTTVDVADACGLVDYRWAVLDAKGEVVQTGSGDLDVTLESSFAVAGDNLGTGEYTLRAIVTDACQNEGIAEYDFTVQSGKKPSPVCITSITVELTPMDTDNDGVIDTGMAVIWAEEFNSSSSPACDDESVEFFIEYIDGVGDETLDENDADSLVIGCDALPDAFMVRMWVRSLPSGTTDYCDVFVVPQNNMQACGDVSSIQSGVSGTIMTELETSVEHVEVKAELSNGQKLNFITRESGAYGFASALGLDVTVTPVKDTDHMNGISTADLIQMQKHILGKKLLDNELREIAADVNNDGKISALDLHELRKLILGKNDQLTSVDSWKFINNLNGQNSYTVKGIADKMALDFTGIKMGDVNITNDPSRSAGRSAHDLVLGVENVKVQQGVSYELPVTAENFSSIEGYQFTLNVDPSQVRITNVKMGEALGLTEDNFGFERIAEGLVSTSWSAADAKQLDQNEVLFTLVVEGVSETTISEALAVNNKVTNAEAYTSSNELLGVALNFSSATVDNNFALYQNRPNPFKEQTTIGFTLPESMSASVTIYDVTGKVLKVIEGDYYKGYNEVQILKSALNATGVLYYQLDSDSFTATRKMVVMD